MEISSTSRRNVLIEDNGNFYEYYLTREIIGKISEVVKLHIDKFKL